jgi:plasmid stabilization system protein ParE
MVGKVFKVVFTKKAKRRRQSIIDFESRRVSADHARRIDREIRESARKLKRLPESHPILPGTEDIRPRVRYTKAFSYKIIFAGFKKLREVVVLTIRHDAEDSTKVIKEVK